MLAANLVLSLVRLGLADECHNICADVKKGVNFKSGCSAFRNSLPRPKVRHPRSPDIYTQNAIIELSFLCCDLARKCLLGSSCICERSTHTHSPSIVSDNTRASPRHQHAGFKHMPVSLQGGGRFELLRRVHQWRTPSAVCF